MIMIIFVVILIFKFNAGITNLHVSHSQLLRNLSIKYFWEIRKE